MRPTTGYRALTTGATLERFAFARRALRDDDVAVRVTFCGVCHSDPHAVNDPAGHFPLTPGHEFVARW